MERAGAVCRNPGRDRTAAIPLAVLAACAVFLLLACDAPLSTYEPNTAEEQAVKALLLDFKAGVNARDAGRVAGLLHSDAKIMIGRERTVLSRDAYLRVLPLRLAESPTLDLGTPKIDLHEDRADVRIYMNRGQGRFLMVFHLLFDNGKWWIHSWEY